MRSKAIWAIAAAMGLSAAAYAAEAAVPNTAPCAVCHGSQGEGNPALHAPALAGQDSNYLARQLNNFRSGKRAYHADDKNGQTMRLAVKALTDADAAALVAHYSSLPSKKVAGGGTAAELVAGKQLFDATCSSCHGLGAQGYRQLHVPALRGLDGAYIRQQLDSFAKGWRGDPDKSDQPAVWMRSIATHLSQAKELGQVLQYIASLPAQDAPK